ncbi:MAG: hypothetical protein AB8B36_06315 [Prochlorococcus sp.]
MAVEHSWLLSAHPCEQGSPQRKQAGQFLAEAHSSGTADATIATLRPAHPNALDNC